MDESDITFPGLLILRTEGRLHFASAPRAREKMRALGEAARPQVFVLEMSAVPDIEYTALTGFEREIAGLLENGVEVWLATPNPRVLTLIERSSLGDLLGKERIFYNLYEVIEADQRRAGPRVPPAA